MIQSFVEDRHSSFSKQNGNKYISIRRGTRLLDITVGQTPKDPANDYRFKTCNLSIHLLRLQFINYNLYCNKIIELCSIS